MEPANPVVSTASLTRVQCGTMPVSPITGVVFDHIAHAVPQWQMAWPRYAVELGAVWNSGGPSTGFAPAQLRFANRSRVEMLMPNETESNDFLVRFLQSHGPGPHHLTFKVPDIELALQSATDAGFDPIGVDLSHPEWREAFLHPKVATGIVVQLAQSSGEWTSAPPDGYPTERRLQPDGIPVAAASFRRVTHAVADLRAAVHLFDELLGGEEVDRGIRGEEEWIDLRWDGPLALRLVAPLSSNPTNADLGMEPSSEPTPGLGSDVGSPNVERIDSWLAGRSGRVHHLVFNTDDPDGLNGSAPLPIDLPGIAGLDPNRSRIILPEDNLGLCLVLESN